MDRGPLPDSELNRRLHHDYQVVALVLQGGGALGAYQGGVVEALDETGVEPDWVAGISIGAINAALIAGNAPQRRLARLREFWDAVSHPALNGLLTGMPAWGAQWLGDLNPRAWANLAAASQSLFFGQRGFFVPRLPPPWARPRGVPGATSYYDTAPLRATLERLVDFDRLNDGPMRVSVGAVQVETGNFVYFDNRRRDARGQRTRLAPEHIMASGALPPAFAPVRIGTHHYWDGGLVSNTPLEYVLDQDLRLDTLAFQVDLWAAHGPLPRDILDVMERQKDIQFSSRTRKGTDSFARLQWLRHRIADLVARLPAELHDDPLVAELRGQACRKVMDVVHLIYQAKEYESHAKDYEFSAATMQEHWQSGYDDTRRSLARPDFLARPTHEQAVATHDIHRD